MNQSETSSNPARSRNVTQRALALPGATIRAGMDWIRDWCYRERHRRLVEELDEGGVLDDMFGAIGATRDQLRRLRLPPLAATQLMTRMMRRLGIRAAATEEPFWRDDAQWQCLSCDNWRRCRRWLESRRQDDEYRAFCPNAERFDRLRAQDASPSGG